MPSCFTVTRERNRKTSAELVSQRGLLITWRFCTVISEDLPVPWSLNTDLCAGNFVYVSVRYQAH